MASHLHSAASLNAVCDALRAALVQRDKGRIGEAPAELPDTALQRRNLVDQACAFSQNLRGGLFWRTSLPAALLL